MTDLLAPLLTVIELVKKRIADHRSAFEHSEAQTRASLIDPILAALGWDVGDRSCVAVEYPLPNDKKIQKPDYSLFLPSNASKPIVIIEAKRFLAKPFSYDHIEQLNTYAHGTGISHGVLTNGNRWTLYDVFKQTPYEGKVVFDVSICNDSATSAALKFLALWRLDMVSSGHPGMVTDPISLEDSVRSGRKRTPQPDSQAVSLTAFRATPGKPPSATVFEDGTVEAITKALHILDHSVRWLYSNGHLRHSDMPILAGKQQKPRLDIKEIAFGQNYNRKIPGTRFYTIGMSSTNLVDFTLFLFRACGVDPSAVTVRP